MAKKLPMTANEFWDTLTLSADSWATSELRNMLAYYLRKEISADGKTNKELIIEYRKWFDSPTNAFDESLHSFEKRQPPEAELRDLILTLKTCPEFKKSWVRK